MEKELSIDLNGTLDIGDDTLVKGGGIGDGKWTKCSYNYNYSAKSCAGIIIGEYTKKII